MSTDAPRTPDPEELKQEIHGDVDELADQVDTQPTDTDEPRPDGIVPPDVQQAAQDAAGDPSANEDDEDEDEDSDEAAGDADK